MNQFTIPNFTEAMHHLNEILTFATTFQLSYHQRTQYADHILHQLQDYVATLFKTLPEPQKPTFNVSYDYATFYHCIQQLHEGPLYRIDIGNQALVTQGYIDIILQAQRHL
ncbi:hypothetical protein [Staphylococcus ratti]|uniref:Uncharacterized protein n=1 Tax=Staphylococcus ratti TaxID=2892440 RepID=A0ABY3PE13_9STAP|nr:hypothetical protein [Staphylococcus ratti]UEX90524.1 hypothetical protein LN051_02325 [Staphylococcus ratti]